jgi:hypothetical protein
MKPVLMIHEIKEAMFSLPLENYTLTFDDGLYSQFYYFDKFKSIPTEKIYFISSGIVCNGKQSVEFPTCVDAHKKAFEGNTEDYMTLAQIKELMQDPLVSIGGHSHSHRRLDSYSKIVERLQYLKQDTETMISWFEENLGFVPKQFCFPYNNDYQGMYSGILKHYGFNELYGRERIPVETLLHT